MTNQDEIDPNTVYIRKLPNTRLRRDVEIARLNDFEVMFDLNRMKIAELILKSLVYTTINAKNCFILGN